MMTELRLKNWMGIILQVSLIISIALTIIGGSSYLWVHGQETLQENVLPVTHFNFNAFSHWSMTQLLSPLGLIEIAMLILVLAQVSRVALLCAYYTLTRDYWFMLFSFFILAIILYSLIWQ